MPLPHFQRGAMPPPQPPALAAGSHELPALAAGFESTLQSELATEACACCLEEPEASAYGLPAPEASAYGSREPAARTTGFCVAAFTFFVHCLLAAPAAAQTENNFGPIFEKVSQGIHDAREASSNDQNAESFLLSGPEKWTSPQGLSSSLQILLLLTVLSLAPAVLLMTTCYVRIIVVLGLLRQALGTGQLPPSQVITSISMFMTMFVMAPVWNRVYEDSIKPYTDPNTRMSTEQAWKAGVAPVHEFMSRQIHWAGNHDDVHLFYSYYRPDSQPPQSFDEVPLRVLLPAYMLSELKTAFLMGFQIYLPFLLIDLVVAAVTISMGMMMLPPAIISLPFKLLLFVLIDGWHLVVGMLLESFGTVA